MTNEDANDIYQNYLFFSEKAKYVSIFKCKLVCTYIIIIIISQFYIYIYIYKIYIIICIKIKGKSL